MELKKLCKQIGLSEEKLPVLVANSSEDENNKKMLKLIEDKDDHGLSFKSANLGKTRYVMNMPSHAKSLGELI